MYYERIQIYECWRTVENVLVEYVSFMENFDSCAGKMVLQMIYGYYCFWA